MSQPLVIGMDLGGTNARIGAFDTDGHLLAQREEHIGTLGPERGLALIESTIRQMLQPLGQPPLLGIGIGCTGPVDTVRGLVNNPYTLAGWDHIPIVARLNGAFNVPVKLENDADAAALGEYWQGAGQGSSRLYAVTVGTGVGTALIVDGHIYRGLDGSHPEGGHMLIDPEGPLCYCGYRGCWESLIAGPAIAENARRAPGNQHLIELAGGDPQRIDGLLVAQAAQAGDPAALAVMRKAARDFSRGIINIILLFVPDTLVLSGGVMRSADLFLAELEQALQTPAPMVPFESVRILPARLGYHAGMYGGAYMILSEKL